MNATNVLKLNEWIKKNRDEIRLGRRTQKQLAEHASAQLGFKVSTNGLREVMSANGLETHRVSKQTAEIQSLKERNAKLNALLIKVVTASTVPEWLRQELSNEDLTEEVKDAIRRNRSAA